MKTAISIPDGVFRDAERMARKLGISRSELYARAVRDLLAAYGRRKVTEDLDRVYSQERADLDPGLAAVQARSMDREEW